MRLCHAPIEVTPSPTPQTAPDIENLMALIGSSSRSGQLALKKACLRRDGASCVVTGNVDRHELREGRIDQAGRKSMPTQCAHIIPFGLRKLEDESAEEVS
ncbi:hypothetical protein IMZ48_08380 [Candidatus Bathyarchaeota archaeon]|nr:hypothetical protein [Candidatus Bathyarchaeota archaeon]